MKVFVESRETFRTAIEQVMHNRMRSLLTMLGVVIGILAVTLMGAAIRGIDTGFRDNLAMLGDDVFFVQKWPWGGVEDWWNYRNRPEIRSEYADPLNRIIRQTPNSSLLFAVPTVHRTVTLRYGDRIANDVNAQGTTSRQTELAAAEIAEGRFITEIEERTGAFVCVLGHDVAEGLFPAGGALGRYVKIQGMNYRVVGVYARQGSFLGLFSFDNEVVIPLEAMRRFYRWHWGTMIQVKMKPGSDREIARDELIGAMRRIRGLQPGQDDDFVINETEILERNLGQVKSTIAGAGLFITALALFVGAIGIMNITFVSVKERTREIGLRRAVGARRINILMQFLIEAATLCSIAGAAGLALALLAIEGVKQAAPFFPAAATPLLIVTAMTASVLTGITAGFIPAWVASRMDPAQALRDE